MTLLLASDLDHTMVQNEDLSHARLLAFNHAWLTNKTAQSRDGRQREKLLVFSTGAHLRVGVHWGIASHGYIFSDGSGLLLIDPAN